MKSRRIVCVITQHWFAKFSILRTLFMNPTTNDAVEFFSSVFHASSWAGDLCFSSILWQNRSIRQLGRGRLGTGAVHNTRPVTTEFRTLEVHSL
uniref:Uncharacterized protein n=1 Tax=Physcomitrium patens TaxID=3218 RepID=A0A2K1KXD7_PHYPA|nr:hypothetical protein PHYPA_005448 [Physcomitrium patens]